MNRRLNGGRVGSMILMTTTATLLLSAVMLQSMNHHHVVQAATTTTASLWNRRRRSNSNSRDNKKDKEEEAENKAPAGQATSVSDTNTDLTMYGVDSSFPIHWLQTFQTSNANPLGEGAKARYEEFMKGCRKQFESFVHHDGKEDKVIEEEDEEEDEDEEEYEDGGLYDCDERNEWRVKQNLKQPARSKNYTAVGYDKRKCPETVFSSLRRFYHSNIENAEVEEWPLGDIHTNYWASPTYMINVWDYGNQLGYEIYTTLKPILEEWSGVKLKPASLYGIRIYKEGSILAPHTDTIPRISSAIINIDQDTEEDWPLEVYWHDGKAHNISMVPGDLVLYESHSLIHGRPFPLKGKKYANLFVHFEPCVDYDPQCPEMAGSGKCEIHDLEEWMLENCPLSCDACDYVEEESEYNDFVYMMQHQKGGKEEEDTTLEEEL